jgi:hypothetical protein
VNAVHQEWILWEKTRPAATALIPVKAHLQLLVTMLDDATADHYRVAHDLDIIIAQLMVIHETRFLKAMMDPGAGATKDPWRALMTELELVDYFNEHVLYELMMLRYSKKQLESSVSQFQWNAMFAAFNVSARNLYEFLKGERDNVSVTDYRAYCQSFQRDEVSDVSGTLQMLNAQCFHMGRKRSKVAADKVQLDRIQRMAAWLETNISRLIVSFGDGFKVDSNKANWSPPEQLQFARLGATGSSQPDFSMSTSTPSEVIRFFPDTKKPLEP